MTQYDLKQKKYQFKIECKNITKLDSIVIEYCMPSLRFKKKLELVTEFEKPGRVAAHSCITVEDILTSRKSISVVSGKNQLGIVKLSCSFLDKQEINLLEGQKELEFHSSNCSSTSTSVLISPRASQIAKTFCTVPIPRESDYVRL